MKRVCKNTQEPQELFIFRTQTPNATWEEAHNHRVVANGKSIPQICCMTSSDDQHGLCAYCEMELDSNHSQVEHIHPKSDTSQNYALLWENMIAVCDGGSRSSITTKPKSDKLHCDAYKNVFLQKHNSMILECEKHFLNPLTIPTVPNLFSFEMLTGYLKANAITCAQVSIKNNAYETTEELVNKTIEHLNLNADNLCKLRQKILFNINKTKKLLRGRNTPLEEYNKCLAERYFRKHWPAFFTTIRCLLGQAAEDYLQQISYQG